jgi:hypothetical protein
MSGLQPDCFGWHLFHRALPCAIDKAPLGHLALLSVGEAELSIFKEHLIHIATLDSHDYQRLL